MVKKSDIGEHDQLAVLYTQDFGKISAIAKSVAKAGSKQASHLDVLNLIDFSLVEGNGHPIITSALSVNSHRFIKGSLLSLALSSFLLEVIDKAIYNNDPDNNLWNFFVKSFDYLNSVSESLGRPQCYPIFLAFQNELLKLFGYADFKGSPSVNVFEEIAQKQFGSLYFFQALMSFPH